jgi:hypothetical protein
MSKFKTLEEVRLAHIRKALVATDGNKTAAAELLNISLRSLRFIVAKYEALADFHNPAPWQFKDANDQGRTV